MLLIKGTDYKSAPAGVDALGLKHHPKAYCIYEKLINGDILKDFIKRYFAPSEPEDSFLGELNLTWTIGTTTETLPIDVSRNNTYYSVEIRLNESALNANSATNVALSMLHEALHAKLIAEFYDEKETTDFKALYAYYNGIEFNNIDIEQENQMMTLYSEKMAQALQDFDQTQGINQTLDFYKEVLKYDFSNELGLDEYTSGAEEYSVMLLSNKNCE